MPHFLFISATNGSNLQLTELLTEFAEELGATTEIVKLEDLDMPLYTPSEKEASGVPEVANDLTQQFIKADALILLAPEYNGSIPPVVTNAIAWMSVAGDDFRAAFNGRFAVVGTHSGGGGFKVVEALRSQLNHLGMIVLARTFTTSFSKQQNPDSARAIFKQLVELTDK
ncbi:MAG: NAD(P)H-dependent oxidoreductase [Verrucomicrobia bacterium]|nr:NAD(P)H-dependent oxidoreductase [Verrucomicrobiota bacterium]